MTQEHPITPPPELVRQWATANGTVYEDLSVFCQNIATEAARWGYAQRSSNIEAELQKARDEELEACCEWLFINYCNDVHSPLRAARRPKPSSLKEQALEEEGAFEGMGAYNIAIIRRALESLPD